MEYCHWLQAVDGLKPSQYLVDTAVQNIEGKITIEEAQYLVDSYYEERREKPKSGDRTEEADKVQPELQHYYQKMHLVYTYRISGNYIRNYLQEFIHMPEKYRDYNITKKEMGIRWSFRSLWKCIRT